MIVTLYDHPATKTDRPLSDLVAPTLNLINIIIGRTCRMINEFVFRQSGTGDKDLLGIPPSETTLDRHS